MKTYALKIAPTTSANAPMMLKGPARIRMFPGIAVPTGTPVVGSRAYGASSVARSTSVAATTDPTPSTARAIGATRERARHVAIAIAVAATRHATSTTANAVVASG